MRMSKASVAAALPALVLASLLAAVAAGQGQADPSATVRILGDRTLWGTDFYRLLVSLPSFQRAGETRVVIFMDRVVGANTFRAADAAQSKALAADKSTPAATEPALGAAVQRLAQTPPPSPLKLSAAPFPDDRTFRITALAPSFLQPGLTIATVLEHLGKPERVTTEVLDDGTERRPIILTIYHYAGGALAFAESDVAPRPGLVNRVFLEIPSVTSSLLKGVSQ